MAVADKPYAKTVLEHWNLRSIDKTRRKFLINSDFGRKILSHAVQTLEEAVKLSKLRWLRIMLGMPVDQFLRPILLSEAGNGGRWAIHDVAKPYGLFRADRVGYLVGTEKVP